MASGLQKTGVEAVVEGLAKFQGDIGKLNSSIASIGAKGNILTRALGGAWNILESFGRSAVRIAEYALGHILGDAIEWVVGKVGELAQATFEAGGEFQILDMRLQRLNFNSVIDSAGSYSAATAIATKMTKEQLTWIQKLAATTPYDFQDIANVYTLARSYGFAADKAKGLTKDISDFAAGMGLGNTEIERIIVNMGQMVQQGKVTQREMNDLARGAFVPVNDVLERMQKNVGMTDKEFSEFRQTGEGVQAFMEAFSQVVQERFAGAAQTMARTFKGATDNAADFVKSIVGFNVVKPILDVVGGKIADILTGLTEGNDELADSLMGVKEEKGNFELVSDAAKNLGNSLKWLLEDLLGLEGADTKEFVDGIISGFNKMADWLNMNREDIVGFFEDVKDTIGQLWAAVKKGDFKGILEALGLNPKAVGVIDGIREKILKIWDAAKSGDFKGILEALGLSPDTVANLTGTVDNIVRAFDTVKNWVTENQPLIEEFGAALGDIFSGVFEGLTGTGPEGVLEGIKGFMQWVIDNKEGITSFIIGFERLVIVFAVLGAILAPIIAPIMTLVSIFLVLGGVVIFLGSVLSALGAILGVAASSLGLIVVFAGLVIALFFGLLAAAALLGAGVALAVKLMIAKFGEFETAVAGSITAALGQFKIGEWQKIGTDMIMGMVNGITGAAGRLSSAISAAISNAIAAALAALDSHSPSKVFMKIGAGTMQGMAIGIEKMAGMAERSMTSAMAGVVLPAMAMSGAGASNVMNSTQNTTYNMPLTINSSAKTEPIIQDYGMLRSLVGA